MFKPRNVSVSAIVCPVSVQLSFYKGSCYSYAPAGGASAQHYHREFVCVKKKISVCFIFLSQFVLE